MHRSIITWTLIVAEVIKEVCCRLHPFSPMLGPVTEMNNRRVFILAELYHSLQSFITLAHPSVSWELVSRSCKRRASGKASQNILYTVQVQGWNGRLSLFPRYSQLVPLQTILSFHAFWLFLGRPSFRSVIYFIISATTHSHTPWYIICFDL